MDVNDEESANYSVNRKIRSLWQAALSFALFGFIGLVSSQTSGLLAAVGIGALVFLSAAAIGAAFGFVFGLPRILTRDKSTDAPPASESESIKSLKKRLLGSNTNLERVSDWLTTMIVGVGLTQLGAINGKLYQFRLFLKDTAKVFPDAHGGNAGVLPAVGPMILIFGLIVGFLIVYVYTRINLAVLLSQVEGILEAQTIRGEAAVAVRAAANTLPGIDENPRLMSLVEGEDDPSVEGTIELMGSLLYQPGRFQDVIDLGGKLSRSPAVKKGEYWLYLAAAFGQKHHELLSQVPLPEQELKSARDNALDCARRAVKIDSSMKRRLWYISDPNGEDNDLQDFRLDRDFQNVTGKRS